ncbi:MAG: hypothetical protein Q7S11_03255 [bacterium]|nr:hypothetical protein [bacterium]
MKTLEEALKFITEKYKNTEANYPELAKLSDTEKIKFDIRHCTLHSVKLAGKLASISEDADHGESLDTEKVKKLAVKELINALVLADRVGLSVEELIKRIPEEA